MENDDDLQDSTCESMIQFDNSMNMFVPESILPETEDSPEEVIGNASNVFGPTKDDNACEDKLLVEDSSDGEDSSVDPIVDFRRGKSRSPVSRRKVNHHLDLNQPCRFEEELVATKSVERDFDLNKLPIAGRFRLVDPTRESDFIDMLRILLPSFY